MDVCHVYNVDNRHNVYCIYQLSSEFRLLSVGIKLHNYNESTVILIVGRVDCNFFCVSLMISVF